MKNKSNIKKKTSHLSVVVSVPSPPVSREEIDHCNPSPCGLNSKCVNLNNSSSCSCLPNYLGIPPYCRPECVENSECSDSRACINQKCRDPCIGACGYNAKCNVINHIPNCYCLPGTTGNPFVSCRVEPTASKSSNLNSTLFS